MLIVALGADGVARVHGALDPALFYVGTVVGAAASHVRIHVDDGVIMGVVRLDGALYFIEVRRPVRLLPSQTSCCCCRSCCRFFLLLSWSFCTLF